jgi:hypothetical protein
MKKDTFIMCAFGAIGILVMVVLILACLIQFEIVGMGYSLLGVKIASACIGAIFVLCALKIAKIEGAICRAIDRMCPLEDV